LVEVVRAVLEIPEDLLLGAAAEVVEQLLNI
jgi:hypothetical protein